MASKKSSVYGPNAHRVSVKVMWEHRTWWYLLLLHQHQNGQLEGVFNVTKSFVSSQVVRLRTGTEKKEYKVFLSIFCTARPHIIVPIFLDLP